MTAGPDLAAEFPQDGNLVYLNHAGIAPWPARAASAVTEFAATNTRRGAADYREWLARETRLRERLARLVGAESTDDIALIPNTSEGLSIVAYGLAWRPGDNVVISRQEFPSNRVVWESLAEAYGVEVRDVDLSDHAIPEDALAAAMDERTRVLPVSAVQYADGYRMDLPRLARACESNGTLFCVDAIQELGVRPLSVQSIGADFLVADGHKWLLGPEGLGVLYAAPDARETLRLNRYGWHMVAAVGNYARKDWQPAASARRFEPGSPNSLAIHALEASLSLLEAVGVTEIERRVLSLTRYLQDRLDAIPGVTSLTPHDPARRAGIVTCRVETGADPTAITRQLRDSRILTAARGGGIRLSPHFYQSQASMDRALEQLAHLV